MKECIEMRNSLLLRTDGYKMSHPLMYPPGMDSMYSYLEARRGASFPKTIFFGLRYYIEQYLMKPFDYYSLEFAKEYAEEYFGSSNVFPYEGMKYILDTHGGVFPIEIRSVPEGTMVEKGNILMSVESTDPKVPWVVNYPEPVLMKVWYPSTVATLCWSIKQIIGEYMDLTVGNREGIEFALHDFCYRGASSEESAQLAAAAHLLSFVGTDTIQGDLFLRRFYDSKRVVAKSIPAAEHSTVTAWGAENEADAYRHMISVYPDGIIAIVSDSYDILNTCKNIWGGTLSDQVKSRNGRLVVRPDSGKPEEIVIKVLEILSSKFPTTVTQKGYVLLPDYLRVIQGDGVNISSIKSILFNMEVRGFAASNVAFGMGGALASQVSRDTQDFSMKCSSIDINGVQRDVCKNPVTASGKKSKRGKMKLILDQGCFFTVPMDHEAPDCMILQYRNGLMYNRDSYDTIKGRIG